MLDPANHRTKRRILIYFAIASIVVLAAIAVVLVAADRDHPPQGSASQDTPSSLSAAVAPRSGNGNLSSGLPPITSLSDPETFARAVAHALFDWDTTTPVDPAELTGRLVTVADPTGEATPGLVADVTGYLPNADAWAMLRRYATRQWIEITSVKVPSLWTQAVAEAHGGLLPGTTAFTVRGVRRRAGVWEGEPVSSRHEVEFTVFIVCAPSYSDCRLLRLSRLNEPLR